MDNFKWQKCTRVLIEEWGTIIVRGNICKITHLPSIINIQENQPTYLVVNMIVKVQVDPILHYLEYIKIINWKVSRRSSLATKMLKFWLPTSFLDQLFFAE